MLVSLVLLTSVVALPQVAAPQHPPQVAAIVPPATLVATAAEERFPATLANGEFGATMPPRGLWPDGSHSFRTLMKGVWNGTLLNDDGWPNYQLYLAEVPAPARVDLRALGVDLLAADLLPGYRQELDLHRGTLTTHYACASADGGRIDVRVEQFAAQQHRELFATRVTVTSDRAGALDIRCNLDLQNTRGVRWVNSRQQPERGRHALRARTLVPETTDLDLYDVEVVQALRVPGQTEQPGHPAWQSDDRIWFDTKLALTADTPTTFEVVTTYRSSRRGPLPKAHDFAPAAAALDTGFEALRDHQAAAFADMWQSRVVIDGDDELQRVADAALFWLYTALRPGDGDSIGPMGLTKVDRNNYAGHVFWDAETWMYPPLLLLHPDHARSMLEYRFARLEGARQNAILKGSTRGTRWQSEVTWFPWESARTGQEATPRWYVAADEIHNNACIALAFWQYGQLHGDDDFWRLRAWPVLHGIAEFYCVRGERDEDGSWHLRDVTGADEYAEGKDDFPYVNGSARRALEFAIETAERLGEPVPDRWRDMARGLVIPFDEEHRRHPEYVGYDGRTIKQADVVLMSYPWALVTDPEIVRADLDYYVPRTNENAPAMSHSIHATLWAQLGETDRALQELDAAWRNNVKGPFLTWSETPNNGCINFTTGMGGFLQALINGFGGVRIVPGGITTQPLLPETWRGLEIRGLRQGEAARTLRVDRDGASFVSTAAGR